MSLVVAIKNKNRFVIGADKQVSTGLSKDHTAIKLWNLAELPDAIMGSVGTIRAMQVIQYSDIIDKNCFGEEITTEFIVKSLVPTIVATLEGNGVDCSEGDEKKSIKYMPNSFIFAINDKAWLIWNDLSVTEIVDTMAIGSGSDIAKGALYATKDKDPFSRIVTCIDAASETTLYVDDGIDILATKIYPEDAKLINKALGAEVMEEPKKKSYKVTKAK
jgi:ATP-dependent protease HslVU (ClpYQ) peptidase subunit